ncbi:MAG: hypothetical protein OEZ39_12070 [Gammaproteobacteria bacterium]|nr:hypothetical protein [Gammaproteobacteria bacterium]MDH5652580.1 hypothetical protein [Gammaproteobacteria bacterium]
MRYAELILCSLLVIAQPVLADGLKSLFGKAINEIGENSHVPVRLPTVIPNVIAKYGVKSAVGKTSANGYTVSLYYTQEPGNAAYAGMISGSTVTFDSLPNTVPVQLLNGTNALFRAVQCGGSCAPANLWWQVEGVGYSIQLKLSRKLSEEAQKKAIIEMANSMSLVR